MSSERLPGPPDLTVFNSFDQKLLKFLVIPAGYKLSGPGYCLSVQKRAESGYSFIPNRKVKVLQECHGCTARSGVSVLFCQEYSINPSRNSARPKPRDGTLADTYRTVIFL